ncbi:MAG: LamG domain-containing protein [Thermofilum sp.]
MPLQRTRLLPVARAGLLFDGVDDRVRVPVSSTLSNFTAKSVVLWLKPLSYPDIWEPYDHGYWVSPFGDLFQNLRTTLVYYLRNTSGTVVYLSYSLPSEILYTWIHVATSWDGSIARLYVNGVKVVESSFSGVLASSAYSLTIGSRYDDIYPYKGLVGGVLIYRRALTDEEVLWNFYYPDNPVRNGLVLWLHWDSIDTDKGVWYDKSGFGNHATLYGNPVKEDVLLSPKRLLSPTRTLTPVR